MKVLVVVLLVLLVLLGVLQYRLWLEPGGIRAVRELESTLDEQRGTIERLTIRNRRLAAEILDLKHGLEAIEERARSEIGMIKDDEIFYQIIEHLPPDPDAP